MTKTSPTPRRLVWAALILIGVLAAAHSALWWWTVRRIEAGLPDAVAAARTYGWEIASEPPRWGGWPATARVRLGRVTALRPFGAATLRVTLDDTDLDLGPNDAQALHLVPHGPVTASIGDGPPFTLRARSLVVRIPLQPGPVAVALGNADLAGPAGRGASIARLDATIDQAGLTASADGVDAIPPFPAPFDKGGTLRLAASITQPIPFAPNPAAAAAAWQAAAGQVDVSAFALEWGPLDVQGRFTGGLDPALQPAADGEAMVAGLPQLLDAASRAGAMSPASGLASRAVMNLLLRPAAGGPARVPLSLADGTLTVARFPLLKLPPLDWGPR